MLRLLKPPSPTPFVVAATRVANRTKTKALLSLPPLGAMDQQSSARWLETLKAENRTKEAWQRKYMTAEQQEREAAEEAEAIAALKSQSQTGGRGKRISERDAMELRLAALDNEDPSVSDPGPTPLPDYEIMRLRVAEEVARTRPRSHRYTGDLSTESMLKDIGPGLWTSINPGYAPLKLASSQHRTHAYDKSKGWGDKVDKTHHLKMDDFMQHAEKSLQLGEKVFVSGGMKLSKG